MKEINRFYIMGNKLPSDDGSIVNYKDHAAIVAALQAESDSNLKSAQYSAETNRKIVKKNIELQESIAALQEQVQALTAENAELKNSRDVLAENALETCNTVASAGFRHEAIMRGLMESTGNRNKYPKPITTLVDEALRKIETPATDAALREIRAQARAEGIHFAANRLLAAWESGFIDDTPAAAHDISGAILSAIEFLPNADEGEFKREYADEVRARIRSGEQP